MEGENSSKQETNESKNPKDLFLESVRGTVESLVQAGAMSTDEADEKIKKASLIEGDFIHPDEEGYQFAMEEINERRKNEKPYQPK